MCTEYTIVSEQKKFDSNRSIPQGCGRLYLTVPSPGCGSHWADQIYRWSQLSRPWRAYINASIPAEKPF
ncbi:hypothetical protein AFLA_004233 [Aspergillus flavus NRRL3357]|nr:hypothetical protein AFLA_004233 [Aspergillus flavus NRRL3357]